MDIVNKGRLTPIFQNLKLKFKNNFRYFNPFRYNSYKRLVVKKKKKNTHKHFIVGGGEGPYISFSRESTKTFGQSMGCGDLNDYHNLRHRHEINRPHIELF